MGVLYKINIPAKYRRDTCLNETLAWMRHLLLLTTSEAKWEDNRLLMPRLKRPVQNNMERGDPPDCASNYFVSPLAFRRPVLQQLGPISNWFGIRCKVWAKISSLCEVLSQCSQKRQVNHVTNQVAWPCDPRGLSRSATFSQLPHSHSSYENAQHRALD